MPHTLAHTIRLYPTTEQETFFKKACGCARVAYNYGLEKYKEQLAAKQKPNISDIRKQFNKDKETLFPWMYETNKDANQRPFTHLQTAFNKFYKKLSKFPKFKKKGVRDSFYISNDKFSVEGTKFRIPRLGWVKGAEDLRFSGKIMSATVRRKAGYWFVVISVLIDKTFTTVENQDVVGVDLGIKALATLSNGVQFQSSNPLRRKLSRLKFLQRRLSRKVKGSANRKKHVLRVSKLHYVVSCIRKDTSDNLTTYLCKNFKTICIEDLNVRGMLRNHKLALSISDAGFGEFRRQLEYKSKLYGNTIVLVDRFYPSSKTCSFCGWKKEGLTLADRDFVCDCCGQVINRDLNAAINIKNCGLKQLRTVSPEVTPVDKKALVLGDKNETVLVEAGILECVEMHT